MPVTAFSSVQWITASGGNDHYYELVVTSTLNGVTWEEAKSAAESQGGYLATITSASENSFVSSLAMADASAWFHESGGNSVGPWLGGFLGGSGWQWVNGEGAFSYTNWAPTEPNNLYAGEARLELFGYQSQTGSQWNDFNNRPDSFVNSYIIESASPLSAEPIPPTVFLFGTSMLGIAGIRLNRKRNFL